MIEPFMVCERADDARCGHHRRWPQRSCLLRLSGDGRSQGIGARSAPRRRGRRGYGRVQPRLSQFSRIVRCFSIEPKNHSRPRSCRAWTADRRALGDGSFLKVGGSHTKREVAKFSTRDADRLDDYQTRLAAVANVLRASVLETPPNVVEGSPFAVIAELLKAGTIANRIRALGLDLQRDFLDLFTASAGDFLDSWFESAPTKAAFGFDSVVGNYASPYAPGSAYALLHHSFGEVNGRKGVWGHAIGGMGAITQAMAKAATAHGVTIRLSTRVRQVLVENGQAIGVETDKGETIRAAAVAAGINPKLLYLHLVDARALPEGFRRRMENWRCGSGTFRMNVALSELPDFTALPGHAPAEHHASGIIIAPSLAYMEQAYFDARTFGWSRRPIIELVIPSTLDGTLAPRGQHVASLFCQHVARQNSPMVRHGMTTVKPSPIS